MNPQQITTKEDLRELEERLAKRISDLISEKLSNRQKWLRSSDVRKMLSISPGTLQNLRINRQISYSRVGGTLYYRFDDVEELLTKNRTESTC
ncbi:helix-turn-helix domain-containing protein [Candidatus Babeliales bacterium]|nr:helix-turn-helix domain-containing protein [Candidatus Babeliales bacterium]